MQTHTPNRFHQTLRSIISRSLLFFFVANLRIKSHSAKCYLFFFTCHIRF
nr:MAG TPA: hypothetical protein [Caudoviricetes sp.]